MKKNSVFKIFLFMLICLFSYAKMDPVSAKSIECVYGSDEFKLIYEDGKLSHTTKDSTGYKTYVSKITIANVTDAKGNFKCPKKLYYTFSFDGATRKGGYTVYPTKADGRYSWDFKRKIESADDSATEPSESTENSSDVKVDGTGLSCVYGSLKLSSDGKTIIGTMPGYNVNVSKPIDESGNYMDISKFFAKCPKQVCYTCSRGYCGVGFQKETDQGSTYDKCVSLNALSESNADELEDYNDEFVADEFVELKDKITNFSKNKIGATKKCASDDKKCLTKQLRLYEEAKTISGLCNKIYADIAIKEDGEDGLYKKCKEVFEPKLKEFSKAGYFGNRIITGNTTGNNCDDTLGSLGEWLTKIFKLMLLAVPVIIMVFGFKDFIKALLSGKDDELKKSGATFIKRLIFGAVFVALPMIIKVILTIALGGDFADICIL